MPSGHWVWDGTEVPNTTPNVEDIDGDGLLNNGVWDDPNMQDQDADGDGILNENDPDDDDDGINDWEYIDTDEDGIPDTQIMLDQQWDDVIEEPIQPQPAPPAPGENGFYLEQPGGPENTYDTSKWIITNGSKIYYLDQEYDHYNWEFYDNSGTWQPYVAPEWGYVDSGYWPEYTIEEDNGRNQEVWVEYELTSHGYQVEQGSVDINRENIYGSEYRPSPQPVNEPGYNPLNPTEPTWNEAELQGEQYDTTYSENEGEFLGGGSNTISFDGETLKAGYEYDFNYSLKYTNDAGQTITHDTGTETFKVTKQAPTIEIRQMDIDEESVQMEVEVHDPQATRDSQVNWQLTDQFGNIVDSGSFDSNHQVITIDGLDTRNEYYSFSVDTTYKTIMSEPSQVKTKDYGYITLKPMYEDEIVIESDAVALQNSILVNLYVDSEFENWFDYFVGAYVEIDGVKHSIELHEGSNQYVFDYQSPTMPEKIDITIGVIYNDGQLKEKTLDYSIPSFSNVYLEAVPLLNTIDITNTEATIGYEIIDVSQIGVPRNIQFEYAEWRIKEEGGTYGEWTRVDSPNGEIYLTNLKPGTTYEIEFQLVSTEDEVVHGLPFKFTTESNTEILNTYSGHSESSFWYTFEVNDIDNWDDRKIYWDLVNVDTGMVEQSGIEEIENNGLHTVSLYYLQPVTNYRFEYYYEIEGETYSNYYEFTTENVTINDGVGYIWQDANSTINNGSMTLNYAGTIRSIELSTDNSDWKQISPESVEFGTSEAGKNTITINSDLINESNDQIYIKINKATVVSIQINSLDPVTNVPLPDETSWWEQNDGWIIAVTVVSALLVMLGTVGFYLYYRNDKKITGIWSSIDLSKKKIK